MERNTGKENIDPTSQWHGIEDPKNISTDSLEPTQVIDTNSETSTSFLMDRSIGPALIGTTSSLESPGPGLMREDGDAKAATTPTGLAEPQSGLINREAEEYADGLARELINATQDMREIFNNNEFSAAKEKEETLQDEEKSVEETGDTENREKAHHEESGKQVEEINEKVNTDIEEIVLGKEKVDEEAIDHIEVEAAKQVIEEKKVEDTQTVSEKLDIDEKSESDKDIEPEARGVEEQEVNLPSEESCNQKVEDTLEVLNSQEVDQEVSAELDTIQKGITESQSEQEAEVENLETTTGTEETYRTENTEETKDELEEKAKAVIDSEDKQKTDEDTVEAPEILNLIESQQDTSSNQESSFNLIEVQHEAQQSFQTAAATSLLVDCDKLEDEEMEFTKNYSDDLLMGQNGPESQKGETMPSADLADFELPPYSGSSSSSETARQQSPAKRQSSSNPMAAQPTSSHQNSAESSSPNLSAVKNLLMSTYSRVSHVLHWKRPIETGIIFGIGLTLITTLTFFSIISVFAYSALGVILASALIRLYKAVSKALNRPSELPFDHLWNKIQGLNVSLSLEKTHELVETSLSNLNASLLYFKQVLLFEDKIATIKFGLFLYMLTYIGAWFNGMTLITISYLALFSVPIFYQKNKTKTDEYFNLAFGQLSSTISLINKKASSLAFGGAPSSSTSVSSSKKQS